MHEPQGWWQEEAGAGYERPCSCPLPHGTPIASLLFIYVELLSKISFGKKKVNRAYCYKIF